MCVDEDVCAVCYESHEIDLPTTLCCGHFYHCGCIIELIVASMSSFVTQMSHDAAKFLFARTISLSARCVEHIFFAIQTRKNKLLPLSNQRLIQGTHITLQVCLFTNQLHDRRR